jgi:uncharacterized protein YegP (UPF0339 family)
MRFEIYRAGLPNWQKWYWRARAVNKNGRAGKIMSDGSEGYHNEGNVRRAIARYVELLGATNYEVVLVD